MAKHVVANKEARNEYVIPITWSVFDTLKVQANSLEEAFNYVETNLDEMPLGDEPDYVEGSYAVTAADVDSCSMYQDEKELVCLNFSCTDKLPEYTDSMLFDSDETVATGAFTYMGTDLTIDLRVCGEVSVTYKGDVYHRPSEFPEELKALIKANPNHWEFEDGVEYIGLNNWFEYIYEGDGDVLEGDLSTYTPEMILRDMTEIAQEYFGIENNRQEVM